MQSSREYQGEMQKPSSVNNAKKQRKTKQWKRLEISSRKLEIPREYFIQTFKQIKDRNGKDLTKAEEIKKRCQEYTEKLYKTDLNAPDDHDSVVTHLKPDILECEVKCTLGRLLKIKINKDSGGVEILAELFKILKDDAIKLLLSLCQQGNAKNP